MVNIIFFFVIITIILSIFLTNKTATDPNKNILLGVTLPHTHLSHTSVKHIIDKYKKNYEILILVFMLLSIPILFTKGYPSFSMIYLFSWIAALFYFNNRVYCKYFKELITLKKENNWSYGINDDDEYWKKGYYYNPNDKRTMVEKRIGYGMTFNMATKVGKGITYGIIGMAVILVIGLSIMFIIFDTSSFKLSIDGNTAKISAPMYSYSFNVSDIEDVKEIDSLPSGIRTNGASTDKYNLGNYNLNGYGRAKMYVYNENSPFIVIKLKDMYIFINGKTSDITEEYYKMLLDKIK